METCLRSITYYFLVKSTGLSQSSISYMMRGKGKPILMICEAMEDLIPNADEGTGIEEKSLIHTFR